MTENVDFRAPQQFLRDLDEIKLRNKGGDTHEDFEIYRVDLSPLKLRVGRSIPFLIPRRLIGPPDAKQLADTIGKLLHFARTVREECTVLLMGWRLDLAAIRQAYDFETVHAAIFDLKCAEALRSGSNLDSKYTGLGVELTRFLGTQALSPYVRRKPAVAGRFFGRSLLVRQLLEAGNGENFTIVGNRRIGKTSVLFEIKDRLAAMYNMQSIRICSFSAGIHDTAEGVVQNMLEALGAARESEKVQADPRKIRDLPAMLKSFAARTRSRLVVCMDEIDRVLQFDARQDNQLFWILKAAFEVPEHRLFMAGFREAVKAYYDYNHPLYNLGQMKILSCLKHEETLEMVRLPLARMGIPIGDSELPETIYRETGGHPELIQMLCKDIIRMHEDSEGAPTMEDILDRLFDDEFEQAVHQTFLANTDVFERALCYLLIRDALDKHTPFEDYEFDTSKASRLFAEEKLELHTPGDTMANIVRNLEVSSIVRRRQGASRYAFAVPQLARYCANNDIEAQVKDALLEAYTRPRSPLLDWPTEEDMNARNRATAAKV